MKGTPRRPGFLKFGPWKLILFFPMLESHMALPLVKDPILLSAHGGMSLFLGSYDLMPAEARPVTPPLLSSIYKPL